MEGGTHVLTTALLRQGGSFFQTDVFEHGLAFECGVCLL